MWNTNFLTKLGLLQFWVATILRLNICIHVLPCQKVLLMRNIHDMWNTAVFLVSCLVITVECLVVSPLHMFYTAAMSYSYYWWWHKHSSMWRWSTLRYIHWIGWGISYAFALEVPGTSEVLMWTLRVKINWILALWLLEVFYIRVTRQMFLCLI